MEEKEMMTGARVGILTETAVAWGFNWYWVSCNGIVHKYGSATACLFTLNVVMTVTTVTCIVQ